MAAQQESEAISGNVRWSIQKRMKTGDYNCTFAAYGFDRKNGELIVKEDEAGIVRKIFYMYLQGAGLQTIANRLNEEGVPRRYGYTVWHQTAVRYILTNERYKGDAPRKAGKGEDGKSVIDVEQADIVKFIYDRYLAGDSLKEITKKLMDLKISTPLGKQRWSCSTVRSILTNEKYKGDVIINKTYVVDCISKKVKVNYNGARKKYYVENNHPAIIDAAMFAKVQEEIARRSGKKKIKQVGTKTELGKYCGEYALTERLLCGECQTPYRRCTWTVKGKKKIVWRCINRLDYGKKYCHNSPTIEENVLHDAIMAAIQQTAQQNMDALQALKTHIGVALGAAEKEGNTVEIELRIAQIDAEFKAMIDTASADTVDGFDENRIQQLIGEKNELQAKLGEITEERGRQQTVQDRLETIYAVLDGLKNHPMTYDDEEVRQLIDCVVVESKDRIKVVFCGGLQVEQPLRQESMDFLSEMGQIPVNI